MQIHDDDDDGDHHHADVDDEDDVDVDNKSHTDGYGNAAAAYPRDSLTCNSGSL